MERITSRKNAAVARLRALTGDAAARREMGEFVCDGEKLLREAVAAGLSISAVFCKNGELPCPVPGAALYDLPPELLEYISPLKNSPGPVFSLKKPEILPGAGGILVLEGVQDPGNVGTVIRTAEALGAGAVVLTNGCADPFGPKAARAAMGSVFRQCVLETDMAGLRVFLKERGLALYGAALADNAVDIRQTDLRRAAVAVGSEGRGLSRAMLDMCDGTMIIPMTGRAESLNAAVAAAIILWEMEKQSLAATP